MDLSRRRFLQTSLTALAGASAGLWPLTSRAGEVVDVSLTAQESLVNLGQGPEFKAYSFNGQSPGPVLRAREGQSLRVSLKNSLPHPTTIHWHGLPVPNPMDGVPGLTQAAVPPGGRFTYQFTARPAGTYFYHSHFGEQLDQGLYGALIVDPARAQGGWDQEEVLVLADWVLADGGGPASARRPAGGMMGRGMMGRSGAGSPPGEPYYSGYAVNGRIYPATKAIRVKRGDRARLRLINASSATSYDLALAGHRLRVIALDGQPVTPRAFDVVRLSMGERVDVEFMADNPGAWLLSAYDTGRGEGGLAVPVVYADSSRRAPQPVAWSRDMRRATYWDLAAAEPMDHPAGEPRHWRRQVLSGGMHSGWWSINGRVHPDSERLVVKTGDKVRLSYFNRSMVPHPMHLHGHFFRIVNPGLEPTRWLVKDTALVEPMRRLDIEFVAGGPGQWFHHCHNLYHMEAGMANVVACGPASPPRGGRA